MKKITLTKEQIDQLSYTDVAFLILESNGKKMQIQELFKTVIEALELPENYFESKIGDFFGLLSTDKRFVMLEKGFWDLKSKHKSKVVIEEEIEDEDEVLEEVEDEEEMDNMEEDDSEINYDDEDLTDDDDEEDALKDLVIMNEGEDESDSI